MSKFNPINDVFTNWNKPLYIASKLDPQLDDYGNEIVVYDKPFYFGKVNYQPLTTKQLEAYMKEYGETESSVFSCLIDYKDRNRIKEFDKVYLNGAKPDDEKVNGTNANYLVRAVKPQNTKVMVLFEKLIREEN